MCRSRIVDPFVFRRSKIHPSPATGYPPARWGEGGNGGEGYSAGVEFPSSASSRQLANLPAWSGGLFSQPSLSAFRSVGLLGWFFNQAFADGERCGLYPVLQVQFLQDVLDVTLDRVLGDGEDCRFLLLQGIGAYDFNKIQD